jgi:hypothetical protein
VQEFQLVQINILDNDYLPDYSPFDFYDGRTISAADISQPPKAGYLMFRGTGRNAAVIYRHDGRDVLTAGIDSFEYRFTFSNPELNPAQITTTSKVYVYVLESVNGGFSGCSGASTVVTLAHKPAGAPEGVRFNWFDEDERPLGAGFSRTIPMGNVDSVYLIHPIVLTGPYTATDFPVGKLTVRVANAAGPTAVMRWTGFADHNWKNPANWVEVKGTYEAPAAWAQTACVDVIIPSGAANYPELTDSVQSRNIVLKDRAMLKNPHVLTYGEASVEYKLTPYEKDRFISWSAPLKDMYSGDYHVTKKSDGTPAWGDTYMMFFQMANPDVPGSVPVPNRLTATFGRPDAPLPLGTAFNFRLTATSANCDSLLAFPRTATSYTAAGGAAYGNLTRADAHRFITDGVSLTGNQFDMPVPNRIGADAGFLQVANPYMAYLNVSDFLGGNSAALEANGYIAWDGHINNAPVGYMLSPEPGMRYVCNMPGAGAGGGMISPLQSFFVMKKAGNSPVKMSPAWTATSGANPYGLRAADETETHVLRIKASQGDKTSYAILYYNPKAHAYYDSREDVYQLFFDDIPLSVYALTPWNDPLLIYSDADFPARYTRIGLRIRDAGEVTLEFSGMPTFGHNVWLVDKVTGKETDLQQHASYAFAAGKAGGGLLELNDRFAIRAQYTGAGITANEAVSLPQWRVSAADREVLVQSLSLPVHRVQVYDVTGALVYSSSVPSVYYRIPLAQGVYIVKARIGDAYRVEKVLVK